MSTTSMITAAAAAVFCGILLLIAATAGAAAALLGGTAQPSKAALEDIPAAYLTFYQQAATVCPGLDWTVLAAIGKIETDHGRSTLPGVHSGENTAGAGGVMQILQPTWAEILARHSIPPGGATPPSRYNPHDAIHAAAFYLCDNGARDHHDLRGAIFAYNHADWYVTDVLNQAARYAHATPRAATSCTLAQAALPTSGTPSPIAPASPAATQAALTAVAFACAQIGKPYIWGGNGEIGFDCSGLTHAAYAAAGITIPRTAQTQHDADPRLPFGTPPQPGDLLFFGTPDNIHHVGISLGGTQMVNAPTFGQPIQVQDYRDFGDYAGLSRPATAAK